MILLFHDFITLCIYVALPHTHTRTHLTCTPQPIMHCLMRLWITQKQIADKIFNLIDIVFANNNVLLPYTFPPFSLSLSSFHAHNCQICRAMRIHAQYA